MSGGHFNYTQHYINDIADEIQRQIDLSGQTVQTMTYGEYSTETHSDLSPEVLAKFQQAIDTLRLAAIMAQRIDWYISCDDGEQAFHDRWNQEISAYKLLRQTP